jgi:hypothetical protein
MGHKALWVDVYRFTRPGKYDTLDETSVIVPFGEPPPSSIRGTVRKLIGSDLNDGRRHWFDVEQAKKDLRDHGYAVLKTPTKKRPR